MSKDEKLLIYYDNEAHVVRRLGAAVIACWDELSDDVRTKLVEQAKRVMDEDDSERFDEQIASFIKDHTGVPA